MTAAHSFAELGISCMDAEHRELARLFDEFAEAVCNQASADVVHAIVDQAIARANAHFEHEEQLMAQTHYPAMEEEKFNHRNLRLKLTTLVSDTVGTDDPVTLEHLAEMRRLLNEHIVGPDRELADFLKAAGMK